MRVGYVAARGSVRAPGIVATGGVGLQQQRQTFSIKPLSSGMQQRTKAIDKASSMFNK